MSPFIHFWFKVEELVPLLHVYFGSSNLNVVVQSVTGSMMDDSMVLMENDRDKIVPCKVLTQYSII
jgi:hypothetical protein